MLKKFKLTKTLYFCVAPLLLFHLGCEDPLHPDDPDLITAEIRNIQWTNNEDNNNNGYHSYRSLTVEYRNSQFQARMFIEIQYKKTTSSYYSRYWQVELYSENWESIDFDIGIQIELEHGSYDFKVIVMDELKVPISTYDLSTHPILRAQKFETFQEDLN